MSDEPKAAKTPLVDQLTCYPESCWATVEWPNGWKVDTNIGHLFHDAATELVAKDARIQALEEALRPFAKIVGMIYVDQDDDDYIDTALMAKDFRRAAALLAGH